MAGVMEPATQNPPSPETYETASEIAAVLKVTPQAVNRWHRKKIIPAKIDLGRIVRFDRAEVFAALEARSRTEAVAGAEP